MFVDDEWVLEGWSVKGECFVFAAFACDVDSFGVVEVLEFSDGGVVDGASEPVFGESFGEDADDEYVEAGVELVF